MSKPNESLKCTQQVRNLPLDRFRLPSDGRKWKQAARSRSDLLLRLSSYANGDGTFVGETGRNYSPSLGTLTKHIAQQSYFRLTAALQELGLLSWTRAKHYYPRIYTIHLPDSSGSRATFESEHIPDSEITPTTLEEHLPHSPKSPTTMGDHPSLPSKSLLPSVQPSVSTADDGQAGSENLFETWAKPADIENLLLSEDVVLKNLQRAYDTLWKAINADFTSGKYGDLPRTPNLTGFKKLYAELCRRGLNRGDQWDLVQTAFEIWFMWKYIPSFNEKWDAEVREEDARWEEKNTKTVSRKVYIPQMIRCPFEIFRLELSLFLEQAKEQLEEEASVTEIKA
jgi:hypothetical protein